MKSAKEFKIEEDEALKEIFVKIAGKGAAIIVSMLKGKNDVDEFKMANKAQMTINELRNILYKLHHNNLVSFIRKKDKKKGWFIYYWTLNKEKAIQLLIEHYASELKEQEDILDNLTKKNYFVCPRGHVELSEESALEQNFECTECGELLVLKDKEAEKKRINRFMEKIKAKINRLKEILEKYESKKLKVVEGEEKAKKQGKKAKAKQKTKIKSKKEIKGRGKGPKRRISKAWFKKLRKRLKVKAKKIYKTKIKKSKLKKRQKKIKTRKRR